MLEGRQIIVVVPEDEPEPDGFGDSTSFDSAVKAPAGEASDDPSFTLYLGINSGGYQNSSNGTLILPPIPIEWIVAPLNVTDGQCHSANDNLLLFGVTNVITMILILFTGCRPLMQFLTRGLLGQPGKYSALWTWIIAFGFQIGSNAVISHLIVTTPGYEHLKMLNVFALYSSRPRINQIWTGLLRLVVGPVPLSRRFAIPDPSEKEERSESRWWKRWKPKETWSWTRKKLRRRNDPEDSRAATSGTNGRESKGYLASERRTPNTRTITSLRSRFLDFDPVQREYIYTDAYVATSVAEFALQLVSAIFTGVTWRRFPNAPIRNHMASYVNCLLAAPALALLGWVFIPIPIRRDDEWLRHPKLWMSFAYGFTSALFFLCFTGYFTYGSAWQYWRAFLELPGSLWCPPNFVEEAAVWSTFSSLSVAIGAAF